MLILDRIQYGYDRDGNVLYQDNLGPSGNSAGAASTVAATFSQLYHANSSASGDDNTAYDPLGRLTSLRRGKLTASANNGGVLDTVTTLNSVSGVSGNQESWSLNAVGGWTSVSTDGTAKTQTTNAQNETTAAQGASLTYDNNGNLTKNAQGDTLKYDAWNRLVNTNSGTGTALEYDALGRWDLDTITSGVNDVYFDMQGHQIETLAGTVYHQYVWGFAYVNEIILRDEHTGSGNNYGMAGSGLNQRLYANQDAEWSTISLVAPGGTVDERMVYDAYGDVNVLTAAWANGSALTYYFRINFQGEYQLSEANVYIMGARDFDYTTGSWDQKDPIVYGDGMNDYQGFGSNPVARSDPFGLDAGWSDWANASTPQISESTKNDYTMTFLLPPDLIDPNEEDLTVSNIESDTKSYTKTDVSAAGFVAKPEDFNEQAGFDYEYRQVVKIVTVPSSGQVKIEETYRNVSSRPATGKPFVTKPYIIKAVITGSVKVTTTSWVEFHRKPKC